MGLCTGPRHSPLPLPTLRFFSRRLPVNYVRREGAAAQVGVPVPGDGRWPRLQHRLRAQTAEAPADGVCGRCPCKSSKVRHAGVGWFTIVLIVWHAHPSPSPLQALLGREDGHMYFGESTILISPTVSWLLGAVGCGHIGVRLLAAPNAAHTVEVSGSISHLRLLFKLYEDCEVWNEAHRNCS